LFSKDRTILKFTGVLTIDLSKLLLFSQSRMVVQLWLGQVSMAMWKLLKYLWMLEPLWTCRERYYSTECFISCFVLESSCYAPTCMHPV